MPDRRGTLADQKCSSIGGQFNFVAIVAPLIRAATSVETKGRRHRDYGWQACEPQHGCRIECNYARKSADSVTTPCCGGALLQSSSSSTYTIRWVKSKPTTVLRLGAEPNVALRRSTRA